MLLITNDETLRRFMPNAFATVKGETPLFDKLAPWLSASEKWLQENFCGEVSMNEIVAMDDKNVVKSLASQIVVCEALRYAVPSLDLVLTPNGFGIVSNQNVAPASKERVERLIDSLYDTRDNAVELLLTSLRQMQSWTASPQWFTATLFPNIDLVSLCGVTKHRWEKYVELRSMVIGIENSLADEYFSHEFMEILRLQAVATSADSNLSRIVNRLKPLIVDFIADKPIAQQKIVDIVNFIRNNPEEFPEWHNSDTAKLFSPPKFENKITNKGYWF